MLEITTTRHNPLVDPQLAVWSWEIPVYLFLGGIVAGLMILGGVAMLRTARGDDTRRFFSMHAPLLGFALMNIGMGALFLDLAHKLYVWRVYVTFQIASPMSWGSWVLIIVYCSLLASALVRLPEAWPWLTHNVPALRRWSSIVERPYAMRMLGWANIVLGIALGIYTGILLNTMVARPLWNTGLLGPLFLFSGLSAGAATLHVMNIARAERRAPQGLVGGALAAFCQQLGPELPERHADDALIRYHLVFIAVELLLLALLLVNLQTSSASHAAAAALLQTGPYAVSFWGLIVGVGLVLHFVIHGGELAHVIPHTAIPDAMVLIGAFALRWVMVAAGQASHIVQAVAN
jgi:protein NrfD